ncbi:AroM family protein [Rhodopila sp.]|uniref:AroM family protein n=1 Tax=Rhodopila sp. TaxID=2480087 RepID=UPI003D0C0743
MSQHVGFVTIGQSPRSDVMPDILAETRTPFEVIERGALDGLDDAAVADLAPHAGEERLVSRLRDGREVLLGKPAIDRRLHAILAELDTGGFDLLVLLCTGEFTRFDLSTPFIEPQHTVDHFVQGIAYGAKRIGILLPNAAQIDEFHGIPGIETKAAAASPYVARNEATLRRAGIALADTDIIVMHCIGYSEAMRQVVRQAAHRPVLLSRRLVAHAIDLVLS